MTDLNSFFRTDNVDDHVAADVNKLMAAALRSEYNNTETLTATRELADIDTPVQVIALTGNQTIELPPEAITNHPFLIYNADSTEVLTVKDDSGTITYAVLYPSQYVYCVQVQGIGWKVEGYDVVSRYSILVAITSNDLVVSLVHPDGTDPSASRPIFLRIGGVLRSVVAATTITIPDGTNWYNAGSATFATKEIDYFLYAIWDSNSSVVAIAPARFPHGRVVSDFSSTTTAEKYIGNQANYTAIDAVEVLGRFAATLSAGAGYTWSSTSQSAPTNTNTIHYPIYETRMLDWVPTWTNLTVGDGTLTAKYRIMGNNIRWVVQLVFGSTTSVSGLISHVLPFAQSALYANANSTIGRADFVDSGGFFFGRVLLGGAGGAYRVFNSASTYLNETNTSSTVPFTFATADEVHGYGDYIMA